MGKSAREAFVRRPEWRDWLVALRWNVWVQVGTGAALTAFATAPLVHTPVDPSTRGLVQLVFLVSAFSASLTLGVTGFGSGTVKAYRETVIHILLGERRAQGRRVGRKWGNLYAGKMYCARSGVLAAVAACGASPEKLPWRLRCRWLLV